MEMACSQNDPEGFTVRRDNYGKYVIVDGKNNFNYVEKAITNADTTGNTSYLNQLDGSSSNSDEVLDYAETINSDLSGLAGIASIEMPNLGDLGTELGAIGTSVDLVEEISEPSVSNGIDLGIDIIGFFGYKSAFASIMLGAYKTLATWWATNMAECTVKFNNAYKQCVEDYLAGQASQYQ